MVKKEPGALSVYGLWDYVLLTALVCVEKGYFSSIIKKWVRGGFGVGDAAIKSSASSGSALDTPDNSHLVHEFAWLGFEGVTTQNGEVNITVILRVQDVTAAKTDQVPSGQAIDNQ